MYGMKNASVTTTEEISAVMTPGTHGTTFGGNPLVTTSGCATLDIMKRDGLVEHSRDLGKRWMEDLKAIGSDRIKEVRGYGMIIGVETDTNETASAIQRHCRENGVLVNVCHGNTVRLIPPLILTDAEKDTFTGLLRESVQ